MSETEPARPEGVNETTAGDERDHGTDGEARTVTSPAEYAETEAGPAGAPDTGADESDDGWVEP